MHRLGRYDFERARELLDAVIERAPRHPDAFAWLAKWHILRAHQGWSDDPLRSQAQARDVAQRALDRDGRCGLALTIAGMVKVYFERDLDEGEQLYRQALDANPSDALAWLLKGTLHGFRGEGEAAVEDTRRALRLSPLDPMRYYYDALAASAAASAGMYGEAIELATRSLRANRMHASTLRVLAISYSMTDQMELARPVVERLLTLEPGFSVTRFLDRAPGAGFDIGRRFAQALARAGVPQ
jgi:tetratricopeptide (TPR) repeat protein